MGKRRGKLKTPGKGGNVTGFARFLMIFVPLILIGGGVYWAKDKGMLDGAIESATSKQAAGVKAKTAKGVVKCVLSPFGGYAGGPYMNNGFKANKQSRFYKEYGVRIEFVVEEDQAKSLAMWANDEVQLHWFTVGAMSTQYNAIASHQPYFLFQTDWSRGGDAIVAIGGINTASDLKGRKVAFVANSPSHTAVLGLLKANNMKISDIVSVHCATPTEAATKFKNGEVHAAAVWAPDDQDCIKNKSGSKVLMSTKQATHIIADCFFTKKSTYDANPDIYNAIAEGWLKGNGEINASNTVKMAAAEILVGFGDGFDANFYVSAINNVRLTSYGDNKNFFGMDPTYSGVTGSKLYRNVAKMYAKSGVAVGGSWEMMSTSSAIQSMDASKFTTGGDYAEKKLTFKKATVAAISSKRSFAKSTVRIRFPSGSAVLSEAAKNMLDLKLTPTLEEFGAVRLRVDGHTDTDGSPGLNKSLSRKRAQSMVEYYVDEYEMDRNRFTVRGLGESRPMATKAKSRRVEVFLLEQ
jgi:NitT/TauT family transport system substrate-binding protein